MLLFIRTFSVLFLDYNPKKLPVVDGRIACPFPGCDFSALPNKSSLDMLRRHYTWVHVNVFGGVCCFCGMTKDLPDTFQIHVPKCLRGVITAEVTFWNNAVIG
jgi:hypothetical protein